MANEDYSNISCVEEWLEGKGWSMNLSEKEQKRLEDEFVGECADVRAAMWKRHYDSLDPKERSLLDDGSHPSYSWDRAADAEAYLDGFRHKLAAVKFIHDISMGYYHGHTIVFTVSLTEERSWRDYRKVTPEFFRGFQVFVSAPRLRSG